MNRPADIMLTECLEANTYYNVIAQKHYEFHKDKRSCTSIERANTVIAEAYLMRAENLTKN